MPAGDGEEIEMQPLVAAAAPVAVRQAKLPGYARPVVPMGGPPPYDDPGYRPKSTRPEPPPEYRVPERGDGSVFVTVEKGQRRQQPRPIFERTKQYGAPDAADIYQRAGPSRYVRPTPTPAPLSPVAGPSSRLSPVPSTSSPFSPNPSRRLIESSTPPNRRRIESSSDGSFHSVPEGKRVASSTDGSFHSATDRKRVGSSSDGSFHSVPDRQRVGSGSNDSYHSVRSDMSDEYTPIEGTDEVDRVSPTPRPHQRTGDTSGEESDEGRSHAFASKRRSYESTGRTRHESPLPGKFSSSESDKE